MPDYQGRDANRIDFTPVGEAANYISLDQVLMLAFSMPVITERFTGSSPTLNWCGF